MLIWLGKMPKKTAETICNYVEQINMGNLAGQSCPAEVARWLGTIGDDLHGKLSKVGLIVLWEKPFQNMRASCATDFADLFSSHVCTEWLGHTEQIANAHYRQVTETHFQKATENSNIGRSES